VTQAVLGVFVIHCLLGVNRVRMLYAALVDPILKLCWCKETSLLMTWGYLLLRERCLAWNRGQGARVIGVKRERN